ncbi:hypothetical protein [Chlamydia felis]|nr:hypothetical protein [Chlamydia felis]
MKWFLFILAFSSPALLIPGCTLIPKEGNSACMRCSLISNPLSQ